MNHVTDFNRLWSADSSSPASSALLLHSNESANRSDGYRLKVFEQSATFVAQLQTDEDIPAMAPPLDKWWIIGRFRIPEGYVPIIVGVASGIFILVLTITAIVLWRCCGQSKHHRQKKYEKHKSHDESTAPPMVATPMMIPTSMSYPSILVIRTDHTTSPLSSAVRNHQPVSILATPASNRRKVPEGKAVTVVAPDGAVEDGDMSQVGHGCYVGFDLPDLPEPGRNLPPSPNCCASSSVLDQKMESAWVVDGPLTGDPELKTRSLPAWVRNKGLRSDLINATAQYKEINKGVAGARQSPRPHVTLRHDTAALIALSKTRNQVQDRAALVHNEATIIFDERTAL